MRKLVFILTILVIGGTVEAALNPQLADLTGIVKNRDWALVLGKALFFDQQAGSDGQSCYSCHFSAGADPRINNVLTPGFLKLPEEDTTFGAIDNFDGEPLPGAPLGQTKSGGFPIDSTYQMKPEDFPLYELSDYTDRNSPIHIATDDGVTSPGSVDSIFFGARRAGVFDKCGKPDNDIFHAGKFAARQCEPRNTPTTVNSVFNLFQFWDGRAHRRFNGVGPFGPSDIANDPQKRLVILDAAGNLQLGYLDLDNASLASQAVGPPLSEKEMSCLGRSFADVGRKMVLRRPLALQKIHPQDSVLGKPGPFGFLGYSGRGMKAPHTYAKLIQKAFDEKYWNAPGRFVITEDGQLKRGKSGYTQMEQNFSMFWGIAIMIYESTLIGDHCRVDDCNPRVVGGVPICQNVVDALTPQELEGFRLFNSIGPNTGGRPGPACSGCHPLPLTAESQFQAGINLVMVERSRFNDRGPGTPTLNPPDGALHDRGFFNIGVSPSSFDPGNGGLDPYGNPLSKAISFRDERLGLSVLDPSGVTDPCNTPTLIEPGGTPRYPGCDGNLNDTTDSVDPNFDWNQERMATAGSFKAPTMRGVGLTPPYFHNGVYSNLRQVVEFYNRGGSRRDKSLIDPSYTGDTSGNGTLGKDEFPVPPPDFGSNVDRFVQPLSLTEVEIDALVAFMLALTDERVQRDQKPFDHPSHFIVSKARPIDTNKDGRADDGLFELPEVGADGYSPESGFCVHNKGDLFAPGMQSRAGGPKVALEP
jgi:cytochrome c peroxidase